MTHTSMKKLLDVKGDITDNVMDTSSGITNNFRQILFLLRI